MPTYAYACKDCDHAFDAVQSFSDDSLTDCPECAGTLRKKFNSVGVVFKGSGFYRNDSRSGGSGSTAGASTAASSNSSDGSSGSDSTTGSSSGSTGSDGSSKSSSSEKASGSSASQDSGSVAAKTPATASA